MPSIRLDSYIVDTLMPDLVGHDRRPSALLVYLFLWTRSSGRRPRRAVASLREIAEGTGLSKRAVQVGIGNLVRRRLVARVHPPHAAPTSMLAYDVLRPWRRR